jgi:hypothetical protein
MAEIDRLPSIEGDGAFDPKLSWRIGPLRLGKRPAKAGRFHIAAGVI